MPWFCQRTRLTVCGCALLCVLLLLSFRPSVSRIQTPGFDTKALADAVARETLEETVYAFNVACEKQLKGQCRRVVRVCRVGDACKVECHATAPPIVDSSCRDAPPCAAATGRLLDESACTHANENVAKAIVEAEEAADKASLQDSNVTSSRMSVRCDPMEPKSASRAIMVTHLEASHSRLKIILLDLLNYVREIREKLTDCLRVSSGVGDWSDLLTTDISHIREYLRLAIEVVERANRLVLEALRVGESTPCEAGTDNLKAMMTQGTELTLKGWSNLQLAYRTSLKAIQDAHFQSGGQVGEIIKTAQTKSSRLMKGASALIQSAANVTWGPVSKDGMPPPQSHVLTPRMMRNIAEQRLLPMLRGRKARSHTDHASTSAFICAQERELRWTPCFQDLCRNEAGIRQSGCMYGCFAVISQAGQEDEDALGPFRIKTRAALRNNNELSVDSLHRALAAVGVANSFADLNAAIETAMVGDDAKPQSIAVSLSDGQANAVAVLNKDVVRNNRCYNRNNSLNENVVKVNRAVSQETIFELLLAVLSCSNPENDDGKNVDTHGCVHFCTAHVDGVLGHSCEATVAQAVGDHFVLSRQKWSRACVLACKQRTSSSAFQNAWGEHGGKIQVAPVTEKSKYGGGLQGREITREYIFAGDRWNVCNITVCEDRKSLKRSGCLYGCRSMVLTGVPSSNDCNQYCDETVDQVLADPQSLGAEASKYDPNSEETDDRKALWVLECKRGCTKAALFYPPPSNNRLSHQIPIARPTSLSKLDQERAKDVTSLYNGGDGVGTGVGEGSSSVVHTL